jgi:hypothetical protein
VSGEAINMLTHWHQNTLKTLICVIFFSSGLFFETHEAFSSVGPTCGAVGNWVSQRQALINEWDNINLEGMEIDRRISMETDQGAILNPTNYRNWLLNRKFNQLLPQLQRIEEFIRVDQEMCNRAIGALGD